MSGGLNCSVEVCHQRAVAMLDEADRAPCQEARVGFLRLAVEWMKLAAKIGDRLGVS